MTLAAYILAATALGGVGLYGLYPMIKAGARIWWPGVLHGLAGVAGFTWLVVALVGAPPRGQASGAGSFGVVAAGLLGAGLVLGAAAFVARWRGGAAGVLVLGAHATLAVAGLVMLVAYLSAPS